VTIRARLTLAVVVLVVAATGLLGWVVVGAARQSMVDRLDERLTEAADRPFNGQGPGPIGRRPGDQRSTAELILDADGTVRRSEPAGFGDDPEPLPDLPDVDSDEFAGMVGQVVTLPSEGGGPDQRVLTETLDPFFDGYRVVSTSMEDVEETTSRLWGVFGLTLAGVAAAGAAAAWWIVRSGLEPVDSMIETAGAIAAGDLTARVDHPADNTELGRLGTALDEMLGRLEVAFDERAASEARLKRFAADASHELRTPITAIRGYAELYQRGGLAEREALDRAMARIEGESTRMGRLVEDLLLLARLDQQRPLERTSVDLHAVVEDAAADHAALDDGHPLTLEAPTAVVVKGDEAGLRQVVGNLLANARTHTPVGTVVRLSLAADDGSAVLTVADDGPGIPAAQLGRVFERFHRGDPSRSRETGGAGLGLSIAAALVAAHGGTIEATNTPGATFTVRLPLP
jgi:two-component system OmpR family sensor kinase